MLGTGQAGVAAAVFFGGWGTASGLGAATFSRGVVLVPLFFSAAAAFFYKELLVLRMG